MFSRSDVMRIVDLSRIQTEQTAVGALLPRLAHLYGNMVDQEEFGARLLSLWQLAETIAYAGERSEDTDRISRRLAALAAHSLGSETTFRTILEKCAKRRNELVHQAVSSEIDVSLCAQIKYICDAGIRWLLSNYQQIVDRDVLIQTLSLFERTPSSRRATALAANITSGPPENRGTSLPYVP